MRRKLNYEHISTKINCLLLLNAVDGLITHLGVRAGVIAEGNWMMIKIVESLPMTVLFKIIVPIAFFAYIAKYIKVCSAKQFKSMDVALNMSLLVYMYISIMHISWLGKFSQLLVSNGG